MFALVALMALYMGGNNIRKAFALAPFGQWEFLNWALFGTGILMLVAGVACAWQANKDYKEKQEERKEQEKAEKENRRRQFYFDDELLTEAEEYAEKDEDADLV